MEILKLFDQYKSDIDTWFENEKSKFLSRPIIISAFNEAGREAYTYLKETYNITPAFFIAEANTSRGQKYQNVPIVFFQDLLYKYRNLKKISLLICSPSTNDDIYPTLVPKNNIFNINYLKYGRVGALDAPAPSLEGASLKNHMKEYILQRNNFNKIQEVYNLLEDARSKEVYLKCLTKRCNNIEFYQDIYSDHQYFTSEFITIEPNEVFIDGGGFNGDTAINFNALTRGTYKHIYSFEPDQTLFAKLKATAEKLERVTPINKGLFSETKTIRFSLTPERGSSKVLGEDELTYDPTDYLEVVDGDSLNLEPTFIKMDIEGSELAALKGFKNTILKYRPKMAICIYHRIEDFWDIPLYIHETFPNYTLHVRHHNLDMTETVLYAIPK